MHFPWCVQRCPYCDFATRAAKPEEIPHDAYAGAVARELSLRGESLGGVAPFTLFFGGGTPSLWSVSALGRVVAAVRALGEVQEVTVECNPSSLTADRVRALADAGVDRLSLGVQSLRDEHLRYLGRLHDADGARRAVRAAVGHRGLRVSADVMFGMHEQRVETLLEDLRELVGLGVEHVSAYMLTIEPETRFGELTRKGKLPRLADDAVAEMYERAEGELDALGFVHYEVSNYARPGAEARHNLAYWRGDAYLGLGAAAVGCAPSRERPAWAERWRNVYDVEGYITALDVGRLPPEEREALDPDTRAREALLFGLRSLEGVRPEEVLARTGVDLRQTRKRAWEKELRAGNAVEDCDRWSIPRDRWLQADGITARLF